MRTPDQLHDYQKSAVNFQCTHSASALWMDMGLGKTAVTLTSISHLIKSGFTKAVLIVAPLRVCRLVWRQEAVKWEHTKDLKFSMLMGTPGQRGAALLREADVYLLNYENLGWLAETLQTHFISKGKPLPFEGIVFDEITKCKNSTTQRVKALRKVLPHFKWRTGLTGTPASNGYKDLHGQYLVLDDGQRLGTSKTQFKTRFYRKITQYVESPYDGAEDEIKHLISDITIEMSAADYNPLPDLMVNDVMVELTDDLRAKYDQMEREFFLQLDNGQEVEVFNQAALTTKCISEGTEVLTDNGWKPIETVNKFDRVWDGIEWVNISEVVYNGYKSVIECFGVEMTPDHKVLTTHGWKQAQEISYEQSGSRFDRYEVRLPYSYRKGGEQGYIWNIGKSIMESAMRLWKRTNISKSKFTKSEQTNSEILRMSQGRFYSKTSNDIFESVDYMEKHEEQVQLTNGQGFSKLWGSWDKGMRKMGQLLCGILGRYGVVISRTSNNREKRCKWRLHERELQMGEPYSSREQQKNECVHKYPNRENYSRTSCEAVQTKTNYDLQENRTRLERGRFNKTRVYDIVNAGERHRFTVRGKDGIPLIVHNCLQFSNGAIYPIAGMPLWEPIHELKLDALEDIIEESNGKPILCSYAYRSDAERIMKRFHNLNPINLTECKSEKALADAMRAWKSGDCPLMIGHFLSMGHGLDSMQYHGNTLVWFGLTWSLDGYQQFNARIRRQGQGAPVICHRIMTMDTLDQAQALALDEKATTQASLRNAVKEYRKQRFSHL